MQLPDAMQRPVPTEREQPLSPSPLGAQVGTALADAGARPADSLADAGMSEARPPVEQPLLSFFVTSVGLGRGGDLGGLLGADAHCQRLADAAGAGSGRWRALLSTDTVDGRDRIGAGPWYNRNGVRVSSSVGQLFSLGVPFGPLRTQVMVDEQGEPVPSTAHDILTGTADDGARIIGGNCQGWTSDAAFDAVVVGHSDNTGAQGEDQNKGWVTAHLAVSCSASGVAQDGGEGRFYCFAAD